MRCCIDTKLDSDVQYRQRRAYGGSEYVHDEENTREIGTASRLWADDICDQIEGILEETHWCNRHKLVLSSILE